jgi:hypothetical protein
MAYLDSLNLCLSPATGLGGSDASATKGLPTKRLTSRLNFALAGYGLLAGGVSSNPEPGVISTTKSKSTNITSSVAKSTTVTMELFGG